ncbi:MAG: hypothetical protein JWN77_2413 [Frankiales bacterium]|nr:hypothetical protein [Frankiales bacterium]
MLAHLDGSLLVLLYVCGIGATIGGACGALAGTVGGGVLWWLAEVGLRQRWLLAAAVVVGGALGLSVLDLAEAMGTAPDDHTLSELLAWRVGPAVAGAAGAVWQTRRLR